MRSRRSSRLAAWARRSTACSTWRSRSTSRATSAPRSTACEQATLLDGESARPRGRATAHALARTDRISDAIAAAERALRLQDDEELRDLLTRLRDAQPRVLPAA